jgi:succinate dehydrogenase / fumarate reductase membrane anchor subunit
MTSLRSPLGHVRGLGSAKDGTAHWWAQRVTAIALVPLSIWFVAIVVRYAGAPWDVQTKWMGAPFNAALLLLLVAAVLYHAVLGMQVVIEDYVHHEGLKIASLLAMKALAWILFVMVAFSLFRLGFLVFAESYLRRG